MTDIVKIAKERLGEHQVQIGKLEEFLSMADTLLKHSLSKLSNGIDAGAEGDDASVRELKTGERVRGSRNIPKNPPPERHFPSLGRLHP